MLAPESSTQSFSSLSSLSGLLHRQLGSCSTLDSSETFAQTFSSFRLQVDDHQGLIVYSAETVAAAHPTSLQRSLEIGNSGTGLPPLAEAAVEMVATDTVLVCLKFGGQCHAYDRRTCFSATTTVASIFGTKLPFAD